MNPSENTVPDQISMSDLVALSETAREEEAAKKIQGPFDGLTESQVKELVLESIDKMEDTCGHPMAAKETISILLQRLASWHANVAENLVSDEESRDMGLGWSRDAGKFQAIYNILETIEICEDDWIV